MKLPQLASIVVTSLFGLQAAASPLSARGPWAGSCTPESYTNVTHFVLKEFQIETVSTGSDSTQTRNRGTLAVENPVTKDIYKLDRINISLGGGVWSVCVPGREAPLPKELVICQYIIERRNKRIGFRFSWYCGAVEKDDSKPYLFDATVIGTLPEEVCETKNGTADGVTQTCSLPADAGEVLLEVQNLHWEVAE